MNIVYQSVREMKGSEGDEDIYYSTPRKNTFIHEFKNNKEGTSSFSASRYKREDGKIIRYYLVKEKLMKFGGFGVNSIESIYRKTFNEAMEDAKELNKDKPRIKTRRHEVMGEFTKKLPID
jgi:hypothetical protein